MLNTPKTVQSINVADQPDPEIARRFVRWHRVKTNIEQRKRFKKVKEGEIYWAAVGQNVGSEVYGKTERFSRPILVYKKINGMTFMAIPLSTKPSKGSWYVHFVHREKFETALLNQAKVMSVKRLYDFMGTIDDNDFQRIRAGFRALYC